MVVMKAMFCGLEMKVLKNDDRLESKRREQRTGSALRRSSRKTLFDFDLLVTTVFCNSGVQGQ